IRVKIHLLLLFNGLESSPPHGWANSYLILKVGRRDMSRSTAKKI
ncbi:unnamed protein product, partial [Amoebophrya sp. A25]